MKTISAAMKAHIESDVTTLATCWKIVRADGQKFFYTEHDEAIVYEGDTYKATGGFNKSSIKSNATLAADEMEVSGFLEDTGISDLEMRNGAFDFAKVEVFAVNYNDLSMGDIKLRSGWFGEVRTSDSGAFMVELRGLIDMLGMKIGRTYLPECHLDLGDAKCGIKLEANHHKAGVHYKEGNRVRYPVDDPNLFNPRHYPDLIDPNVVPENYFANNVMEANLIMEPLVGPKVLRFTGGDYYGDTFSMAVTDTEMGITPEEKASGLLQVTFSGAYFAYYKTSLPFIRLFQKKSSLQLAWTEVLTVDKRPNRTWYDFKLSIPVHPEMTYTAMEIGTWALDGKTPSVCFDNLDIYIESIDDTPKDYRYYGNREFVCINPGYSAKETPIFNTELNSTTVDGGVIWEARRPKHTALCRVVADAATVKSVFIDTDAISPTKEDGWYHWGVAKFLTGPNAGRAVEVLSYNKTTGEVTFALPLPYKTLENDLFTMHTGCDKRFKTCKDKLENQINFRGFPRMPGEGKYFEVAGM